MAKIDEHGDVDVGHLQRNRLLEQAEQRRLGAERDDRERGERGDGGDDRRDREEERVGRLRPQLLLEHQLDDVGERLQRPFEADAVRAAAILDVGAHLPLHPDHEGGRQHQHVEDDEDQPEVRDDRRRRDQRRHQCAPTSGLAARQSAGTVQRPSRTCASNSARKFFTRRQRRRRRGVAERAQRLADDVVADADEQIDVAHLAFAVLDPREDLEQPVAAFAARRALAARLVLVEVQQVLRRPHHAGGLVHDDDARRAQHRSGLGHVVEGRGDVELIGQQDRHRRAAGDDRLELVAVADAAGELRSKISSRSVVFIDASKVPGLLHVAADAEQLRAAVLLGAERREPLRAIGQDRRQVAERLDVVDRGRAVVEPGHGRERRLDARLRALAFERFDQRRLFAGFVGAGAAVDDDVAVPPACP